jgi:hypothetical protein
MPPTKHIKKAESIDSALLKSLFIIYSGLFPDCFPIVNGVEIPL